MKSKLLLVLLMAITLPVIAKTSNFTLCKSKFALCTTALCDPIPGKKGFVSCHCSVQQGYSLGQRACTAEKKTSKGKSIQSRYYPVKYSVKCTNNRPWAWCLDSPCLIDKKDPSKAECLCSIVKNKGPYVITTDTYNKKTCTTGIYSSATVNDVKEATKYLKSHKELPPSPIKVLNR